MLFPLPPYLQPLTNPSVLASQADTTHREVMGGDFVQAILKGSQPTITVIPGSGVRRKPVPVANVAGLQLLSL